MERQKEREVNAYTWEGMIKYSMACRQYYDYLQRFFPCLGLLKHAFIIEDGDRSPMAMDSITTSHGGRR